MKQQWQDKMRDHEFPLQGSDWADMEHRLGEGATSERKPFIVIIKI
jgi:hypothetical protein